MFLSERGETWGYLFKKIALLDIFHKICMLEICAGIWEGREHRTDRPCGQVWTHSHGIRRQILNCVLQFSICIFSYELEKSHSGSEDWWAEISLHLKSCQEAILATVFHERQLVFHDNAQEAWVEEKFNSGSFFSVFPRAPGSIWTHQCKIAPPLYLLFEKQ